MVDLVPIAEAAANLATLNSLMYLVAGTLVGLVFGVVPGLGGTTAIALLTPITFGMQPFEAITLMAGIIASTATSGAITAILINTPGTAPNAATVLDGYPLTQQGKGGYAIGAATAASGLGGILGMLFLVAVIPITREIVLLFGPPEFCLLGILGLVAVSVSTGAQFLRGLIVAGFGLLLSFAGYDFVSGELRYTFGSDYMYDGIKLVPAMIGIFAIAEMINLWVKGGSIVLDPAATKINFRQVLSGCVEAFRYWGTVLRGSAIGAGIGALPGVGGTVASFMAYAAAMNTAKDRDTFGTGNIVGVIAPEAANNAKDGGALVPTLAFGIPGSAEMAVFLGVLILHGLNPGPTILVDHPDVIWTLIMTLAIAGVVGTVVTLFTAGWMARLTLLESSILVPSVLAFSAIGAYSLNNEILDVVAAFVFGVIGFGMMRLGFPRLTFPIALVLGEIIETAYFQSMTIGDGNYGIFVDSTAAIVLVFLIFLTILFPAMRFAFGRLKGGRDAAESRGA